VADTGLTRWTSPAETVPGLETPVCTPLLRPQLLLGAPQMWTFAMIVLFVIGVLKRLWPLLPLALILQGVAIWGTAQEQHWFEKAWRSIQYAKYYKP